SITLSARVEAAPVGHRHVFQFRPDRRNGVAELFIYIHEEFQNAGLGTTMMMRSNELAKDQGLHRLGLTVVADNHRAIKVYEKVGFKKEGTARDTFYGDDERYHDEVQMGITF